MTRARHLILGALVAAALVMGSAAPAPANVHVTTPTAGPANVHVTGLSG